jgi:hypothetical protein
MRSQWRVALAKEREQQLRRSDIFVETPATTHIPSSVGAAYQFPAVKEVSDAAPTELGGRSGRVGSTNMALLTELVLPYCVTTDTASV